MLSEITLSFSVDDLRRLCESRSDSLKEYLADYGKIASPYLLSPYLILSKGM